MSERLIEPLRDGEPCSHRGCLSHVSHPCEGCGRIAGRYPTDHPTAPGETRVTNETDPQWSDTALADACDGSADGLGGSEEEDFDAMMLRAAARRLRALAAAPSPERVTSEMVEAASRALFDERRVSIWPHDLRLALQAALDSGDGREPLYAAAPSSPGGEREVRVEGRTVLVCLDSHAEAERLAAALRSPVATREPAATEWRDGAPAKPWSEEWFLAQTTFGDVVVLRALPEEYTYDFKTADDTYIKRDRIKRWAHLASISEYAAPVASEADAREGAVPAGEFWDAQRRQHLREAVEAVKAVRVRDQSLGPVEVANAASIHRLAVRRTKQEATRAIEALFASTPTHAEGR